LIGGELRFRAATQLGWEGIEAYVGQVQPGEILRKAFMDNKSQEMFWLDRYECLEGMKKADPNLTIQALADSVEMARPKVSRILKLMEVLGPSVRGQIRNLITTTPDLADFLDSFETGALGDLPGTGDQTGERVEACLKLALDRRMTGIQVRSLVGWVKEGHKPEDFVNTTASGKVGKFESKSQDQPAAKAVEPPSRQGHQENQANGEASIPASKPEPKDPKPLHFEPVPHSRAVATNGDGGTFTPSPNAVSAQLGSLIAGKELAKRLHLPAQALTQLFPGFARLFQRVIGIFERLGVKNRVTATILALFLVLFVGSTLIGWSNRLMGWVVNSLVYSHPVVSRPHLPLAPAPAAQSAAQMAVQAPNQQGLHNSASDLVPNPNPAKVSQPALSGSGALQQALPNKSNEPALSTVEGSNGLKSEVPAAPATLKGTGTQGQSGGETKKDLSSGSSSGLSAVALAQAEASAKEEAGAQAKGSAKNEDPLKAIGDGVKDATDAVNKAKEGQSDVDKVKNLFGF
jgi:plasmid maintenance system antidote protein VapI